jgi:hypothetical protein
MVAFASTPNTIGRKIASVEVEIWITPDYCRLAANLFGSLYTMRLKSCPDCIGPEKCVKSFVTSLVVSEYPQDLGLVLVYGEAKVVEVS